MKKILFLLVMCLLLCSCGANREHSDIAATTLPVWEFTTRLCEGTNLTVTRLVTESVSCLHDYSLNVAQVKALENADLVVTNGAGLEEFMHDLLHGKDHIDSSEGIELTACTEEHDHEHDSHEHAHDTDTHIWLSISKAKIMADNICRGLIVRYPQHQSIFEENLAALYAEMDAMQVYADDVLSTLSCRELVTFHDGFGYLAADFDLHILEAVEEESGAEASAAELKHMIGIVRQHNLPAIFTETNGSGSAAAIIAAETGANVFTLDMAMAGDSWFDAMYHNINTLKEALG